VTRADASRTTILLVEDDHALADLLRESFTADGYVVCLAPTGAVAEALIDSIKPDLIFIDLMLPDEHGLLLCANLKQRSSAPIIVYSGTRRKDDAALAFRLGATDFVPKPASLRELQIRIQRALQMPGSSMLSQRPTHRLGPLALHAARRVVTLSEQELAITPTEYRLLYFLLERADQAVSVRELAEVVWGHYDSSLDESARVHLRRLRAKLRAVPGRSPELIAVRGFGYRLVWHPGTPTRATSKLHDAGRATMCSQAPSSPDMSQPELNDQSPAGGL
jgi:DNA-binding response OmpR family regulator